MIKKLDSKKPLCYVKINMRYQPIILIILFSFIILNFSFAAEENSVKLEKEKQAQIYYEEGYRLQSQGDYRQALSYYTKAIILNPNSEKIYNELGIVYEKIGDISKAIAAYKKALELNPYYLPSYTNLALLYEKQGNKQAAIEYWKKRYQYGKKGEYWTEKAKERLMALNAYPQIKKEAIEKEAAILSRQLSYLKKKQKEQEKLERLRNAQYHYQLGFALFKENDYARSLVELEKAMSYNPSDYKLQLQISELYQIVKRMYAKEHLKRVTQEVLTSIEEDNYRLAREKMENALSEVSSFSK